MRASARQVGAFRSGKRDGPGVYAFANGDCYQARAARRISVAVSQPPPAPRAPEPPERAQGNCAGDLPHGPGVYTWAQRAAVYEGDWAAGQKHGYCVYTAGAERWAGACAAGLEGRVARQQHLPAGL